MSGSEDWIAKRAYELWDRAGRPDGRSEEFWFAAKEKSSRRNGRERRARATETRRRETAADRAGGTSTRDLDGRESPILSV